MYKSFSESSPKYFTILISLLIFFLLGGCRNNLPVKKSVRSSFQLINQDSSKVIFPNYFRGNITVMSFMYTNCPDVCPLTTNNLRMIQKQLERDDIQGIQFVELSFDPDRDTPSVLKKYAAVRDIDQKNFQFLTGKKSSIDSLLKVMNIYAIPSDTIKYDNGGFTYSFIHTDRITLIDKESRIRKEYKGSIVDTKEIIDDIKSLR